MPSLARALEAIGDPWSFLLLGEIFLGVRKFDDFQASLGIARNTLTNRLVRLAALGLVQRRAYQHSPPRHEYHMTSRGVDTYQYALALMRWGDEWLAGEAGPPHLLIHKCGKRLTPMAVCKACKQEIQAKDTLIDLGDARISFPEGDSQLRYSPRPELYTAGRPSSVYRAQAMIGDRWGFLVLWLVLAGITKFDHFRKFLSVSRPILATRLEQLVASGLLERHRYLDRPPRYDYQLTRKGLALCPALLTMFGWAQRAFGSTPFDARITHLPCGKPLVAEMVCASCGDSVNPQEVSVYASQ